MQLAKGYLIKNNQTILTTTAELTQVFLESIKNHRIIKLDGAQSFESLHLRTKAKQLHRSNMKRTIVGTMSIVLVQIFAFIFLAAAIYFVTPQILKNEISPGEVGSFVVIVLMLFIPVKRVLCINQCLQQVQQDLENIFSLLNRETEEDKGAVVIKRARGDLVFDKVSFCHDLHTESALSNITLRIKPGEIVALTGTTQSSKTVLIDLMLRFLRPTSGRIMLDGHDLANLKLTGLRANIALISRNVTLFDDTVAANIAYGAMRCASEAEITSVAQSSLAVEFIREMPQGLQTMIGEQGIKLTEKQRQHIAIARAQLKDPAILVFNEIAIAAEPDDLQYALKILMQGRASLVITNHLPTLNLADRIISV
jgi:subfamily B ATP-binding cassette protein MsbA